MEALWAVKKKKKKKNRHTASFAPEPKKNLEGMAKQMDGSGAEDESNLGIMASARAGTRHLRPCKGNLDLCVYVCACMCD